MKIVQWLLHALACCRRVLLLLLLGLALLAAGIRAWMPDLDELRPQIESYLKQELNLRELKLGPLSWYWAGFLWVSSDRLDFATADSRIAFHHGSASIRIPMLSLLRGDFAPDSIRLSNGELTIDIAETSNARPAPLPRHLRLERVNLRWRFGEWQGFMVRLNMRVDGARRRLEANSSAFRLLAALDEDGLPAAIDFHCLHTDWLPTKLRRGIKGSPMLALKLERQGLRQWRLTSSLDSKHTVILFPGTPYSLPLSHFAAELALRTESDHPFHAEHIEILQAHWRLQDDQIALSGEWSKGKLHLQASSPRLPLRLVWQALRPLGDQEWRHWLALMHQGYATAIEGAITMPLSDPLRIPVTTGHYRDLHFHVRAHVQDAEIALGESGDWLRELNAEVDIDERGLSARIDDCLLPHRLGRSAGSLRIPWSTFELQIEGHGLIDAAKLLAWRGPRQTQGWRWLQAKSDVSYSIRWFANKAEPHRATALIQPIDRWKLRIHDLELSLLGGMVKWDRASGIEVERMQVLGKWLQGALSFNAAPDDGERWKLLSVDAQAEGDLAPIAGHLQLPIANAGGVVSVSLIHDHRGWSGRLDLTRCGWDQLLGFSKRIGTPFAIVYQGRFDPDRQILELSNIQSEGEGLQADGAASLSSEGLRLRLAHLKTSAFDGALDIRAPFGDAPWEIDADASYLNRRALPEKIETIRGVDIKSWKLRARIQRFDWDAARISGVSLRLSSTPGSLGVFEASQIHTAQLNLLDIRADFTMPGDGEIDLRQLSANVEKQHLSLIARLKEEKAGGVRWRGFAIIEGDFGHLMRRGRLSERFEGGVGHILFAGEGIALRNQPWWQGMQGRLRLRVDDGRILEGGTMSKFLAAINLAELPRLLVGNRKDLIGAGVMFKRLQAEAAMRDQHLRVLKLAMRASAFDIAGHGAMDIDKSTIDVYVVARPFQNLDAILGAIPLLRDLLGGRAHSIMRKVYRIHGPLADAEVDEVLPEKAGFASPGLIETLLSLPSRWFGNPDGQTAPSRR